MSKVVLWFNAIVMFWFGIELVEYYGANRFVSDFVSGFVVHDAFLPVVIAVLNSIVVISQGFDIKERVIKRSRGKAE